MNWASNVRVDILPILPPFSIRVRGIISVTWFPRGVTSQVENPFESHPPTKNLSIRFRIDNEALLLSHTVHPSI
jgi:hypothetical protein